MKVSFRRWCPNMAELNAILTFIGFALFSQIVYGHEDSSIEFRSQGATLSILYRCFSLIIALILIINNCYRHRICVDRVLKSTFCLFALMSLKLLYALFLAPYSHMWSSDIISLRLSFLFGVTIIPLYAMVLTFYKINWSKVFLFIAIALLYICLSTLIYNTGNEGRIDLNSHQSSLAFGAYSAYLFIIACCTFSKDKSKILKLAIVGLGIVGLIGLLKAGSRSPLISAIAALFPLLLKKGNGRYLVVIILGIIMIGPTLFAFFEDFAPVIFERLEGAMNKDESTMERLIAFDLAINQMLDNLLCGESPIFYSKWAYGFGPHNLPLQVAMGLGIGGFVWVCILYIIFFRKSLKSINGDYVSRIFACLMFYFLIRTQTGVDIYYASDFGLVIIGLYMYKCRFDYGIYKKNIK